MRRLSPGFALALLLACREPAPQPAASPPAVPAAEATAATPPSAAAPASALESCVDRWLAARGLNEFGDPEGTAYAGGTPLFDELTGTQHERLDYVFRRRPQARADCLAALGDAGPTAPATGQ